MNKLGLAAAVLLCVFASACSRSVAVAGAGSSGGGTDVPVTPVTPAEPPDEGPAPTDADVAASAIDALLRGCDVLDSSNCLYPFPNDHFTVAAADGSIQSPAKGGTGRRVNMSILATPKSVLGLPVDPAEWNRNDGFSPGALAMTYVPSLSLTQTFGLPAEQIGIVNPALSQSADAPILVLEVPQAPETAPRRHLVISELDATAATLLQSQGEFQGVPLPAFRIPSPNPRSALLIRPATNYTEGHRYVVVLRNLRGDDGKTLAAQAAFRMCRDKIASSLPPVSDRCAELEQNVFPVLDAAGIARNSNLYLAWDFTVASTQSQIGRLRHMRDDAFSTLARSSGADCIHYIEGADCNAPEFTVDTITMNPRDGIAKRIEGTITVPSYVLPPDPSPAEYPQLANLLNQLCDKLPDSVDAVAGPACDLIETAGGLISSGSLPPNRLFYLPTGGTPDTKNLDDPTGLRYGDGLPDRIPGIGTMKTRYFCQIPDQATPDNPARAGVYGHGLLDSRLAVNYDGVPDLSREFNYMFCAVDFFGFATGDLPNVLTALLDLSLFPVVPDGSQQGMLNFMYLARLLHHPQGFASNPEFQMGGRAVFDRTHVYYDGNSQGGILGGVVVASSPDIERGVLGSLGMNYSTLLNRSKDFDQYAIILYAAYEDSLDRQLLFSMMQMLWDRSENDGYAAHITDNSAFDGPPKIVKLDTQFGDHQVTPWTAMTMARTLGIPADFSMNDRVAANLGEAHRNPDVHRGYAMTPLDLGNAAQTAGGAMFLWDDARSAPPPVENLPPRPEAPLDRDPHDDSAKKFSGRCQKAHFLREGGTLIGILGVEFDGATCPPVPPAPPVAAAH